MIRLFLTGMGKIGFGDHKIIDIGIQEFQTKFQQFQFIEKSKTVEYLHTS